MAEDNHGTNRTQYGVSIQAPDIEQLKAEFRDDKVLANLDALYAASEMVTYGVLDIVTNPRAFESNVSHIEPLFEVSCGVSTPIRLTAASFNCCGNAHILKSSTKKKQKGPSPSLSVLGAGNLRIYCANN